MKQKKLLSISVIFAILLTILPNIPVLAEDTVVRFKRVTSAEEITPNSRYLIVGCSGGYEQDEAEYYTMADYEYSSVDLLCGYRNAIPLVSNTDGTLSFSSDNSNTPLTLSFVQYSTDSYYLMTKDNTYLNGAYATGVKTYAYDLSSSKSLPIANNLSNHKSKWQPIFRSDGIVLFKTSMNVGTQKESSAYIRMHHQANNGGVAVFSGGMLNDIYIDLPSDGSLTYSDLKEENIPVKTYLYKEVCPHSEGNLTCIPEKASTCFEQGNIEYYYCSYCGTYLNTDKTKEIKLEDTKRPLAPHTNTEYVPASEPTCTHAGNIAYTHCKDCDGYFEGDATKTPIDINDTAIAAVSHSYVNGVCCFCGKEAETAHFNRYGKTGNGTEYIFAAEYNNKFYAMGEPTEKGMKAVEVTEAAEGKLAASSESVAFADEITDGSSLYIKIGANYLKNNSLMLTLVPNMDNATSWSSNWGYDASDRYGNYLSDAQSSNAQICLVTDDGDPYFSMCETADETHIAAYRYGEVCSHPNLTHVAEIKPTCTKDGNREYRYCDDCGCYFSDEDCLNVIDKSDITVLAAGAEDFDNNGTCDLCGKPMPVYTKVTSENEIVMGNKYILVSKIGDSFYVLKMPEADKSGEYYDISGIEMPAERISEESDGSFKFNSAYSKGAIMMKLGFACECTALDKGSIRYELRTTAGNKSLAFESNQGFNLSECAKYGWRIALNDNGTIKMADVYDENWNAGTGLMRAYRITEKDDTARVIFSVSEESSHRTENTDTVTEYPVYLYRLTETGAVNGTAYILNDAKSTVYNNVTVPSKSAAELSNVEGVSQALTAEAISGFVTQAASGEKVHMNVDVNITASNYTAADKETGAGGSITFTLSPTVNVATESNPSGIPYNITDSAFDGSPMTVMLYTGGIEPQQIIHIKQDGTKEYFYPEWTEEVMKNGEKAFTQSYDNNGNMYVRFTITEFSDIKLMETPQVPETNRFSILDYDEKARSVTVSCTNDGEYTMIFADYEKDTLSNISMLVQAFKQGTVNVEIPKDISISYGDKIFVWENMSNVRPICEAYTVQ